MGHSENTPGDDRTAAPARRRGPDLVTLVTGLGALAVAVTTLLGGVTWLPGLDVRWVLAATAILIGLVMVVGSLRPRRG